MRPVNLPLELKYHIISMLDAPSLAATCSSNSVLSREAERYLYTDVHISNEEEIESFMYALTCDPGRAKRVTSCTILDFDAQHRSLVHDVLKAMTNLRSLAIIPNFTDLGFDQEWDALLTGCEFKLLEFVTSFDCDRALADVSNIYSFGTRRGFDLFRSSLSLSHKSRNTFIQDTHLHKTRSSCTTHKCSRH